RGPREGRRGRQGGPGPGRPRVKPAQLLLAYHRLVEKERELRDDIERVESLLASDPNIAHAEAALAEARQQRDSIQLRLRESDRERESHRTRLRSREKELMSGRIRNPTELIQLNREVEHMKTSFAEEEEAELRLMEEGELAEQSMVEAAEHLQDARSHSASDEPALRRDLESWQAELESVKAANGPIWGQLRPARQQAYPPPPPPPPHAPRPPH